MPLVQPVGLHKAQSLAMLHQVQLTLPTKNGGCASFIAKRPLHAIIDCLRQDIVNHTRARDSPADVLEVRANELALAVPEVLRRLHYLMKLIGTETLIQ